MKFPSFVFLPRPAGRRSGSAATAPAAMNRAVKFGDGWHPMLPAAELKAKVEELRAGALAAGRAVPEIIVGRGLKLEILPRRARKSRRSRKPARPIHPGSGALPGRAIIPEIGRDVHGESRELDHFVAAERFEVVSADSQHLAIDAIVVVSDRHRAAHDFSRRQRELWRDTGFWARAFAYSICIAASGIWGPASG